MLKFLDSIKVYIAAFMAVVGVVSFIWAAGVKSERKTNENQNIKQDVIEIKSNQIEQKAKTDSLFKVVSVIKSDQDKIMENQNAMRNSYVNYLTNQKSLTKEDFLKYMNGLEFQLTPLAPPVDNTKKQEFRISVKKIKK